ncbi:MAG: hypothetical protein A2Z27_05885 [candidate division Zixibacteria bacterium RBG_16_50_21]|nr:MAG: hypothetical protein A2Z27_05885 [candidate division Zixibacteria bacterium RBG_16_50_21]
MNCFYHKNTVAVGICRNCCKGVCEACANEESNGITCSDACTSHLKKLDYFADRVDIAPETASKSYSQAANIFFIGAISSLILGIIQFGKPLGYVGLGLMIISFVWGLQNHRLAKQVLGMKYTTETKKGN